MASDENRTDNRDRNRELERYREAATGPWTRLEWCIDYLYRVHKPDLARAIARNRKQILKRIR